MDTEDRKKKLAEKLESIKNAIHQIQKSGHKR